MPSPAACLGPEDPAYIKYQAESPDEAALVAAGTAFGFFFHKRNHTSVLVREPADPDASAGTHRTSEIAMATSVHMAVQACRPHSTL